MMIPEDIKPKILITFKEGGENGGPYNSHQRIMNSRLKENYSFVPLMIPKGRMGLVNINLLFHLVKVIKKENPAIVHFAGLQLEGFYVALACRIAKTNMSVMAIHGSSSEALDISVVKKKILCLIESISLKLTDITYGVSEYVSSWNFVKKNAKSYYGHIYNIPIARETYVRSDNISFRGEISANDDDILVISTGRITKDKGFRVLLNIIKNMSIPENLKFIIVGEGAYLQIIHDEIVRLKLENNVFLLGYRNDISRILSECDIFIMPSLHETLCMSVLEAGYCGLPSIVSNVGGLPEIIEHNYNGYLAEVNNEQDFIKYLNLLISNDFKRKEMGKNAKELISSKFCEKEIINHIENLYTCKKRLKID